MPGIQRIEDIRAWQKARELVRAIYEVTATGNISKDFALRDQLRRAALSCMTNIAEGFARTGKKEFRYFLNVARGSGVEVQSLLYVALDVAYIEKKSFDALFALSDQALGLITAFARSLK